MEGRGPTPRAHARLSDGDLVMLDSPSCGSPMECCAAEGFEPTIPPVLVRDRHLFRGAGLFPGEREM